MRSLFTICRDSQNKGGLPVNTITIYLTIELTFPVLQDTLVALLVSGISVGLSEDSKQTTYDP